MQLPLHKLRSYSDTRLLNVVIYRERYNYPFDYVEACKDELRKRGYSNEELQQAINASEESTPPLRFQLRKRFRSAGKLLIWLPVCAVILFAVLVLFHDSLSISVRQVAGGSAVLCLCLCFLVYAYRTVMRGNLARYDNDSSDNSSDNSSLFLS